MSRFLRALCASVAGGVLTASAVGADVTLEVKAVTGVPAPGAPPSRILEFIGTPVVNDAGQVAFDGQVRDALTDEWGDAVFGPDANGQPTWIASSFEPVPDLPPETYFQFGASGYVRLGDDGTVVFDARLRDVDYLPVENRSGIWRWKAGSTLDLVARQGDPVPEAGPGAVLGLLAETTLGSDGTVGFVPLVEGTEFPFSPFVLVDAAPGQTTRFVPQGAPVPGVPGAYVAFYGWAAMNDHGAWTFDAAIEGGGVVAGQDDVGTFTWDPESGLALRVRAGDPAPGTPPGVVFHYWNDVYPNAAGDFAYRAYLTGPGVSNANDMALFGPTGSGGLTLLAREGDPAPGTEAGTVFQELWNLHVVINAGGEVVFSASLAGPLVTPENDGGLWRYHPATGAVELLARAGDPAPELPGLTLRYPWPLLNDRGDVVYIVGLVGEDATPETDLAIFALPAGATGAQKVFREGDLVPFGPGDLRPVTDPLLQAGYPSDGPGAASLSDAGHLVFKGRAAGVDDVVVVATIPEPGPASGLAAGVALLAGLARARRRRQARASASQVPHSAAAARASLAGSRGESFIRPCALW
jgi:hypothetical protein